MEDGVALPEDVLIEILVNLPVKSLMRFRCVSKYWCDLIKSPNFVSRHLNRDSSESVLLKRNLPRPSQDDWIGGVGEVLSFHDPDSLDSLVFPNLSIPPFLVHLAGYKFDDVFYDYMGTCNGLVCLVLSERVILCNPALQEFELLPPSPFVCAEGYVALARATGFGFDAITDAYKVLQFWEIVDREKDYPEVYEDAWMRIDLYNSSTNSWRLIDALVPWAIDDCLDLFLNGAYHWRTESCGILAFDLSTEVFQHFEHPHFGDEKFESLVVLNQCLSFVRAGGWTIDPQLRTNDPDLIEIWVKEYGVKESWTKEFVIGPYAFISPILLLKNEWLLVRTHDNQLASCALHGNEIKRFHFYDNDDTVRAKIFKESLISLKQVIFRHKED